MSKLDRLHQYLCDLNPLISPDALLLSSLIKISHIGTINHLQVQSDIVSNPEHTTPANIYGVNFMDSGTGKDKPMKDIDKNILIDVFEDFYTRAANYREQRNKNVEKEADEKYGDKRTGEKIKFIQTNSARYLPLELSDATLEGFEATRQEYQRAGFGGTFVKISEFGDYITTNNMRRMEFLSMVSEVYDSGDSNPKAIKGEIISYPVRGIPSTAILHTSPAGLLEGQNRSSLFSFLNRGLARRSFICYPKDDEFLKFTNMSAEKIHLIIIDRKKKAEQIIDEVKKDFENFYFKTRKPDDVIYHDDNTFTYTPEANKRMGMYNIENNILAMKISKDSEKDGIRSDLVSRNWKTLKLAGVIAAYEHPEKKTVEIQDVERAIEITNRYSTHLARFYTAEPTAGYEKLYSFFMQNIGVWVTTMHMRKERFVSDREFRRWFDDSLQPATELLENEGYVLQEQKHGKSGVKYRVMPIIQTQEKEEDKENITISIGKTNSPKDTEFNPLTLSFEKLSRITGLPRAWCATTFTDNYRKDDNATGKISLIVMDIDQGLPLDECIQNLTDRKIKALITTTKSHRVEKDGKGVCDRYRVILPLEKPLTLTAGEYKEKITLIADALNIPNDPSTRNISRLWFGNPEQNFTYIPGGYIDISVFTPNIEKTVKRSNKIYDTNGDDRGIKKWFADNHYKYGGRNNMLYIAKQFFLNDKDRDVEYVKSAVIEINSMLTDPLSKNEVEKTVFKSLVKKEEITPPKEEDIPSVDDLPF